MLPWSKPNVSMLESASILKAAKESAYITKFTALVLIE